MKYRFNEGKMFMDISDGMAVIINSETGIYYGMNQFGTMVFDALCKGMDTEDIKDALKHIPSAPSDIEERFSIYLNTLLSYDLLVSGSDAEAFSFDESIALADDFNLEIDAYDDAQEMLLADPIHEVDEETGWTPEKESIAYSKEETKKREEKID